MNTAFTMPYPVRQKNDKPEMYGDFHHANYVLPDHALSSKDATVHCPPAQTKRIEDYRYYIAVVQDEDGNYFNIASPALEDVKDDLLQGVGHRLADHLARPPKYIDEEEFSHQQESARAPVQVSQKPTLSYPLFNTKRNNKRRRSDSEHTTGRHHPSSPSPRTEPTSGKESCHTKPVPGQKKALKARKILQYRVDDHEKWEAWFTDSFRATQQQACRQMAKEWIKTIHPKKQSTHPYNGNMPRSGPKDPERTRPPYWPPGIPHKEPDHIDKDSRVKLLCHLISNTPQQEIVPEGSRSAKTLLASDLLKVLENKEDEYVMPKMDIIREVIHVRSVIENWQEGGIDASALIDVTDWSESVQSASTHKRKRRASGGASKVRKITETEDCEDEKMALYTPAMSPDTPREDPIEPSTRDSQSAMDDETSFSSNSFSQDCQSSSTTSNSHQSNQESAQQTADARAVFETCPPGTEYPQVTRPKHLPVVEFQPHGLPIQHQVYSHPWTDLGVGNHELVDHFDNSHVMIRKPEAATSQTRSEGNLHHRGHTNVAASPFHDVRHFTYNPTVQTNLQPGMHHLGEQAVSMHQDFDIPLYDPYYGMMYQ